MRSNRLRFRVNSTEHFSSPVSHSNLLTFDSTTAKSNHIRQTKVILSFQSTTISQPPSLKRNAKTRESISQTAMHIHTKQQPFHPSLPSHIASNHTCGNLLSSRLACSRSLVRSLRLSRQLLLGLLVAMRDEAVEEAVRAALGVALGFGALDLAVQVAGGFLVDVVVVVVVQVDCCAGGWLVGCMTLL